MDSGNGEFKHFEVVAAVANDHHYLSSNNRTKTDGPDDGNANSSFQNIMIKEWKILEENLPDAIYVRAYETRTDLMRAVIIGAPGTPYHDGLFFFDICLPSNYPNAPPKIYYHSHGHRLNPNLYESGYVCLSLVNTWRGSEEEMWSKKSTLLQILVSIQGLVLNERPYFNEPGYVEYRESKDAKWMNESIRYSENAFIMSCKTLLQLVKKPPVGFESFVVGHFKERAAALLVAVEGYQGGDVVAGESWSSSSSRDSSSFKASLVKLHSMIGEVLLTLLDDAATLKESEEESGTEDESEAEEEQHMMT